MGAAADAEIIAKAPVVEVVAALETGSGIGRDLVLPVTGGARITSYNVCYTKLLRIECWTNTSCWHPEKGWGDGQAARLRLGFRQVLLPVSHTMRRLLLLFLLCCCLSPAWAQGSYWQLQIQGPIGPGVALHVTEELNAVAKATAPPVITSYSIHYTKLYDPDSVPCRIARRPARTGPWPTETIAPHQSA